MHMDYMHIGAVLLQSHEGEVWKLIAYASKSVTLKPKTLLTDQERSADLACTWYCLAEEVRQGHKVIIG